MYIGINEYKEMDIKEFIEKVEEQEYWDDTECEVYKMALEEVGLDFNDYDDPDKMWNDFLKAVNK